ncbi:MAG: PQQ-binding-like beta-propeller repeat protein [Phycisphaerae bacterium]|nr:PQQ-binding-like beta-propeller repeat protein [Phycisphaerae bacterium]
MSTVMHSVKKTFTVKTLNLLFALAAICIFNGCKSQAPEPVISDVRIPINILEKVNLQEKWFNQTLPMDPLAVVRNIYIHDNLLLVLDSRNKLHALDADRGIVKWSVQLCGPHYPVSTPEYFNNSVMFICDQTFVEVKLADGQIIKKMDLGFPSRTSVARWQNAATGDEKMDYLFVGQHDGDFNCIDASNGLTIWKSIHSDYPPKGRIEIFQDKVYFTDSKGTVYCSPVTKRENIWSAGSSGQSVGPIIKDGQCFVANTDTALRCYDAETGTVNWKYLAGGPLVSFPVITDKYVYQAVTGTANKLVCLNAKTASKEGNIVWELKNGKQILAEDGEISYAVTNDNYFVVMSANTGKQKQVSFPMPGLSVFVANDVNNMIYLATEKGAIIAIKPMR